MLHPYQPVHFPLLQAWITGPDLLFQFAGPDFTYPISEDQIRQYQDRHPDRRFYVGFDGQVPYAFGEIIPQEAGSVRLGRLLVGHPGHRGKGMGTAFVQELLAEAIHRFGAQRVDLYVWERNAAAIRCYEKSGFAFCPDDPLYLVYRDILFHIRKMSRAVAGDPLSS